MQVIEQRENEQISPSYMRAGRKRDMEMVIRAQERNAGAMGHSLHCRGWQPFERGSRETLSPVSLFSGENRILTRSRSLRAHWRESLCVSVASVRVHFFSEFRPRFLIAKRHDSSRGSQFCGSRFFRVYIVHRIFRLENHILCINEPLEKSWRMLKRNYFF